MKVSEILEFTLDYNEILAFFYRDTIEGILNALHITVVVNRPGSYESNEDGYIVIKDETGQYWKLDFYDDSYNTGIWRAFKIPSIVSL